MVHPNPTHEEVTLQGTLAKDTAKDMEPIAVHQEAIRSNGSHADTPRPLTSISNHSIRKEDMDPSAIMEVEPKENMEEMTAGQLIGMECRISGTGPTGGISQSIRLGLQRERFPTLPLAAPNTRINTPSSSLMAKHPREAKPVHKAVGNRYPRKREIRRRGSRKSGT